MVVATMFWLVLLSAGIVVVINGSREARLFLVMVVLATVATTIVDLFAKAVNVAAAYLAIDLFLLAIAVLCVVRLRVFWPIWFAGFQTITVMSELARLTLSGPIPSLYADVAGFWAVPALVTMAIGVFKDRRSGLTKAKAPRC